MERKCRIAIFASGNGSNAENIIRHFQSGDRNAEVALLISNRKSAFALERAASLAIPAIHIPKSDFTDEDKLTSILDSYGIDFIVLAGFLLVLPAFLTERYKGRIVNIHPSLLPAYGGKGMYGMHVHQAVVGAGERYTGITIHHVTEHCDEGDIIFRTSVEISPDDTPESVAEKVHELEYRYFPEVIEKVIASTMKRCTP